MATPRVGILPSADRQAIFDAARKLKLNPYEFGAFLSLEAGANMDPNIQGGAGGRHYGLIQFGPSEQQKYLDPSKKGQYTRAEQIPAVLRYFEDRGYKPGMGIERAYATVLGGNPNVSLNAKDSFGTSVAGAASRFRPGGDLYKNAQRVLGDDPGFTSVAAQPVKPAQPTQPQQKQLAGQDPLLLELASKIFGPILAPKQQTSPLSGLMKMFGAIGQ
jgi:hypothetical protein